ncbi:MAG: hypothetical protein WC314_26155, partial [Vulcanimicrobiota bacterium]
SAPSLAISKTPYLGVSPLKAGHSNRIECGNNPVNMVDPAGLEVTLNGSGPQRALFNNLVTKYGLSGLYAGAKGDSTIDITIDLSGSSSYQVGVAYGQIGNRSHIIDIDDIANIAKTGNQCEPGYGDAIAGGALTHELVEAILEGKLISQNPGLYKLTDADVERMKAAGRKLQKVDALYSQTHPTAQRAEDDYLRSKGLEPRNRNSRYRVHYDTTSQPLRVRGIEYPVAP